MPSLPLKISIGFLFIAAIFAAAYFSYMQGLWRFNYPSNEDYPLRGLDVSHHQGEIDWRKVPKDYSFVYIKATEGGDYVDKNFEKNWAMAHSAHFRVGAYHFFTLCRAGAEQARNFIDTVPLTDDALPPVVDLEFIGNCKKRPTRAEFSNELNAYISAIENHYGQKPVLYTTTQFYGRYLKDTEFKSYPLWVRNVFKVPNRNIFPDWKILQYADNARIPGIEGPVDLNVIKDFDF